LSPANSALPSFLQRLMHVHAAAVVADDGLRHEGKGLAIAVRDVLQRVLEDLHLVGLLGERIRGDVDLALAGGRDLVMVHLELETHLLAGERHRRADVLLRVHGRHREVASLDARAVALVAVLVGLAGVPGALVGVHLIGAAVHGDAHLDVVENEELVLRTEQGRIGNAGGFEVGLGTLRERARVTLVALHGHGLDHVAAQIHRRLLIERIDHGGRGIRHQNHVGLVDALPAGDRRAVEHLAVAEEPLIHETRRDGDVLFLAQRVGKAEIGEFRFFFVD
jgi:hypothetical protein